VAWGDLNRPLPVESASVDCTYAFSVLEHLLMPCAFLAECHRVLRPGGRLVLLTPNISTYFTAALVLAGRMPSSGPHPDALSLQQANDPFKVSGVATDALDGDTPEHRHLVVFSYSALRRYLEMAGFKVELARGFGLYPLPLFLQPLAERIDPWHCHQLVFACSKR
jgi:predicted SAM-dependent methyltransferase